MTDYEDTALASLIPYTKDIEPSASIIDGRKELELRDDNIPLFSVI